MSQSRRVDAGAAFTPAAARTGSFSLSSAPQGDPSIFTLWCEAG